MTDSLDTLSDQTLEECFAIEVAEWKRDARPGLLGWRRPDATAGGHRADCVLPFCTDANAVLGHGADYLVCFRDTTGKVFLTLWTPDGEKIVAEAEGKCFAHAYTKALLRAARASKEPS